MDIEEQYDKIFHYCYYRIRDKNVAEDITQEVFLRFYNSNYVEQQKEIRYLYTIARKLCIDEYRKRKIYKSQIDKLKRLKVDIDKKTNIIINDFMLFLVT